MLCNFKTPLSAQERSRRRFQLSTIFLCSFFSLALTVHAEGRDSYSQINDAALKQFLESSLSSIESEQSRSFDRYDAEVWLERTLAVMQRFKLEKPQAMHILKAVHRETERTKLPPDLVLAVIEIESYFNRYAVSRAGAQGLMQVMPFWKKEIGRPSDNLIDIDTNIRYGCSILAYYLKIAKQDWAEALARYNGSYGRTVYSEKVLVAWGKRWKATAPPTISKAD